MSKGFMKYMIYGNAEDVVAFESVMRHIAWCIRSGSSRDIKICVDGDGSASLRFFCDETPEDITTDYIESCREVELSKEFRDKIFKGEEINMAVGKIEPNGNGEYYIGE